MLNQAQGTTVNWYLWGGSAAINDFVDAFHGGLLREEFGVTLNRVPVADTVNAVNLVLSEAEAGVTENGSVDLIWINGENFFTLRQANLLYGPWAETIPDSRLVDWGNPAVTFDFGVPVEGYESPWSSAQFHYIYDSTRMSAGELPRTYDELDEWIRTHPGRFTYVAPGPGAFQGTRFVKQVLYYVSGGFEQWVGGWKPELYREHAPALWARLNEWEPLPRRGKLAAHLWMHAHRAPTAEVACQARATLESFFTAYRHALRDQSGDLFGLAGARESAIHFGAEVLVRTVGAFQDGYLYEGLGWHDPQVQEAVQVAGAHIRSPEDVSTFALLR